MLDTYLPLYTDWFAV